MRVRAGGRLRNERGATLAVVAVCLFAFLGMMALAIDLSMLFKARTDAQRAADASSLAGASAFLKFDGAVAADSAHKRAMRLVTDNLIMGTAIDTTTDQVRVDVITDSQKVRVWVRRPNVGTWFARTLAVAGVPIGAKAAAWATNAGVAKCVKPFAVPDFWNDPDDDINKNNWPDVSAGQGNGKGSESWTYNPPAAGPDSYRRFQDTAGTGTETGLGSDFRNNTVLADADAGGQGLKYYRDQGRAIVIKPSDPHATPQPGYFYPWVLPGSKPGAQDYQANIEGCNTQPISLGTTYGNDTASYASKPGNMIGPTKKGMDSLISEDPKAHWVVDPPNASGYSSGHIEGSKFTDPMDSPRVMLVPLTDPKYVGNGKSQIQFNNMTLMFVESFDNAHGNVTARFIRFATGTGTGPVNGSLIKKLQLVE